MKTHHVGIIVDSIEKDTELYKKLGYQQIGEPVNDMNQFNRILFLTNSLDGSRIELIEALDDRSSVINLPQGYAHICYETEDLDAAIEDLKREKIGVVFTKILVAPAIDNRSVVFAYLKNKTIIEFVEKV